MAGIYIHIPFCRKACTYCNFHFSTSLGMKDDMINGILWELAQQREYLNGFAIETIYFGGGTPSLLSASELNRIFDFIFNNYNITALKECTLEANPDDLNASYLKSLRSTPINRFSIGVQSFFDNDLRYMNRVHNAQQADTAIKAAQDAGFEQLSIDLIYGTPGLSDQNWLSNIKRVKDLAIPHFSAYALTVEEGTALHYAIDKKKVKPVDQEQSAAQFELLMEEARVLGFDHYEISNLASNQQYAVHNTNYWRGVPYLGIGPSAHSFDGKTRRFNIANNVAYLKSIFQDKQLAFEEEILTDAQRLNEYIMTSIRTMWGCDLTKVSTEWGSLVGRQTESASQIFQEKKWLTLNENKLLLTNAGKLFADHIASELFVTNL